MVLCGSLCAPFPAGVIGTQQAMQRTQRGRCLAVLQQIGMDFRRGLVTVGRAVEDFAQRLRPSAVQAVVSGIPTGG
jgi:hypothetical protein